MLVKALIVAIVYYLIYYVSQSIGLWQFNRPIIVGPIMGLLLGDLQTGIILGGVFESAFLGAIAVGGAIPVDALVGSTIGTATAILTGAPNSKVLVIAVPVVALAIITLRITYSYMALFVPRMDKLAHKGNEAGITRWHIGMGFMTPALNTIAIFFAILLGTNAVRTFLTILSKFASQGLVAASKMLPAVGLTMLLNMLFKKKYFIWFLVGFALVVCLKLPNLVVAIFATAIVFLMYDVTKHSITSNVAVSSVSKPEDKQAAKKKGEEDFLS